MQVNKRTLAAWSTNVVKATVKRDQGIVAALAAGWTSRQIAEATGLSHTGVLKIAARVSDA